VTVSTSLSRTEKVCALCGSSLAALRPDARFCTPACRVEARRISAILSPANPEPYLSVAERFRASEKAYKRLLTASNPTLADSTSASTLETAIGRLLSGNVGTRQAGKPRAQHTTANDQLSLFE
jgi:hypothetical protein